MDCGIDENLVDWDQWYILPFYCKRGTKLVNFQFKLFHGRIATNSYLFCEESTETLIHLFWDCKFVKTFWQNVHYWLIQHQINHNTFY